MFDLEQWLQYIETLSPKTMDLSLDRVLMLGQRLGLRQFASKVIAVGGTNGKGSTVKCLESIYLAQGYQVMAYTSPHLLIFNERLRINGVNATDSLFLEAFAYIESHRGNIPLTFFEFTTLAILALCKKILPDIMILEVGLGGRLDAVNIVMSDIAVITNIALDHTEWLGNDRESIAREKAGILNFGNPLVCMDKDPPHSLLQAAQDKEAPLYLINKNFSYTQKENSWDFYGKKHYRELPYPALYLENAVGALALVDVFSASCPVNEVAIRQALTSVFLPGRFDRMSKENKKIIFDVAHNPAGMELLAGQLKQLQISVTVILGMLKDKNIEDSIKPLIPYVHSWIPVNLEVTRDAGAKKIAEILSLYQLNFCYNPWSVSQALEFVLNNATTEWILICGSFYTVAQAMQYCNSLNG